MYLIMLKIFELIKKLKIETPKKADVAIYDKEGIDFLSCCVLDGIEHTVLNARQEYFYFNPKIIFLSFLRLNYRKLINPKTFFKELYKAYSLACLTAISPKVVLTFIDNNPLFYSLSKSYPQAVFYAIQNGNRIINDISSYESTDLKNLSDEPYDNENSANVICFGKNEINYYRTYGVSNDNCYPLGSLKGSYYKHFLTKSNSEQKYIICYVSQYRKSEMNGSTFSKLESGVNIINTYLNLFLKDTGSKICIAMAGDTSDEYNYYKNIFGDNAIIQPKISLFSTYNLMCESQVIVTFFSTAAIEALGWGKKILLCNFFGYSEYIFNISDICTVNTDDYNVFKNKLCNLIQMDAALYSNIVLKDREYFMNYDPSEPATEHVRRMVLDHLSDNE